MAIIREGDLRGARQLCWHEIWRRRKRGGRKFLSPKPLFLPAPPERRFSAAQSAAINQNFFQKKFERRSVIATSYRFMEKEFFGYREINPKTACPGNLFLNDWKKEILDLI